MSLQTLVGRYPWLQEPVIINGPMRGVAGASLATQVSLAGGFGFIGGEASPDQLDAMVKDANGSLIGKGISGRSGTLAIGIGALLFAMKLPPFLDLVRTYRPAAVWLFAAQSNNEYAEWSKAVRQVSSDTDIWIQVGSVTDAVAVVSSAAPDVIVAQGGDAGGHGIEKAASIISLVPEISDALQDFAEDKRPILTAAGGIMDGRGVAASLVLGAEGAVLGTRFVCSEEVDVHENYTRLLLEASDGGRSTVKAKLFDELRGPNVWPSAYDGRSILTKTYTDFQQGASIDSIRSAHTAASEQPHRGIGPEVGQGIAASWAGTGVGLVKKVQKAGNIVREIRGETASILSRSKGHGL